MPAISPVLFKRYEREVGPDAIEAVAKDSCHVAATEERELVIQNIHELCNKL